MPGFEKRQDFSWGLSLPLAFRIYLALNRLWKQRPLSLQASTRDFVCSLICETWSRFSLEMVTYVILWMLGIHYTEYWGADRRLASLWHLLSCSCSFLIAHCILSGWWLMSFLSQLQLESLEWIFVCRLLYSLHTSGSLGRSSALTLWPGEQSNATGPEAVWSQ